MPSNHTPSPKKQTRRRPRGDTRNRIYTYMREQLLAGQSPTVREIRDALGLKATQTVQFHLSNLVDEGKLVQRMGQERGRARGYSLPGQQELGQQRLVPLLGRVQAGALTAAIEDPDGYLSVQTDAPAEELFSLRVRGESMVDAGILPGDIVVVRCQPRADDGDIVVAMVEDEATVKTLRVRAGRAELHPENKAFSPIIPASGQLTILGKVIEVRRYL